MSDERYPRQHDRWLLGIKLGNGLAVEVHENGYEERRDGVSDWRLLEAGDGGCEDASRIACGRAVGGGHDILHDCHGRVEDGVLDGGRHGCESVSTLAQTVSGIVRQSTFAVFDVFLSEIKSLEC